MDNVTSSAFTPSLLLDLKKMRANIERLQNHLSQFGVGLRLHAKTGKSIAAARECNLTQGIAVSTLAEAEYFFNNGINDIVYAVGITPNKLPRVMALRQKGLELKILVDNLEMARTLANFPSVQPFDVLVEIDCDGHRAGVKADSPELLAITACLSRGGENIAGVLTHAGSAYELHSPEPETFRKLSALEVGAARRAASRLRLAGYPCPIVSVGSTPTAMYGTDFDGITEVRAGVFPYMDCVMASLGVCKPEDIALSVLCSVVSVIADGQIIIDAGWTALSGDQGRNFARFGYGLVCNQAGTLLPGLHLAALNQEHGLIKKEPGYSGPAFKPGDLLRILPVHACAAANSFQAFNVLSDNPEPLSWQRCQGW